MPGGIKSLRYKILFFASLIALTACLIFFLLPAVRQFLIVDFKTDKLLYAAEVKIGDKFSIVYFHSVNKSPIEDQFCITGDYSILLQKSVFKSFGAGVPSNKTEGGRFEFYKDRIEVADINRKICNFLLSVGVTANHHFMMNGQDVKLDQLSSPQSSLHFVVEKITVYQYLKYILNKNVIVTYSGIRKV